MFGRKLVYHREWVVTGDKIRKVLDELVIKAIKESAANVSGNLRIVDVKLCELWLHSSYRLEGSCNVVERTMNLEAIRAVTSCTSVRLSAID